MAALVDVMTAPPEALPDQYSAAVGSLSHQVLTIFQSKGIPYVIMAQMATDGYTSLEDLADRWESIQEARQNAATDLCFRHTDRNGLFDQPTSARWAMRISQCVRQAQQLMGQAGGILPVGPGGRGVAVTTATGVPSLDALCDRRQILQLWVAEVRLPVPRLEDQGSDQLLKRQFKHCSQGEIGWIASKYIISALPEQDERPIKSNRKITVDGWEKEEEEETRKLPTTRRQLEHMHLIFRTNLLMAKLSFPSMPRLNVTHADLEDWYRWFWGKDIADRRPPPSEQTLLWAERNAWREIHNLVYGGMGLKEAMDQIRRDTLFWTREVYESVLRQKGTKGSTYPSSPSRPAKSKGRTPSWSPSQPQWNKAKSSPKGKTKGAMGAGKGKDSEWPSNWAKVSPKGVQFCRDHFLKKKCPGNCGRSHNCPVMKNNWVCNAAPSEHTPDQCPNR